MLLAAIHDTGWFPWFPIIPIVFWITIIVIATTLWRRGACGFGPGSGHRGGAEAILAERFARGEIDESQYRKAVSALHERRP